MPLPPQYHLFAAIVLVTLAGGLLADLQAPTGDGPSALTTVQKEAALQFAKEHHPQLHSLIRRLDKRDAAQYEQALADVWKTCERLARVQSRDLERYNVDLALWKADSRIRLLAARMASSDKAALEDQLRSLLNERTDLRLQQLELERQRLTARVEKLKDQMTQLQANRDTQIDKDVDRLLKSVRKQATAARRGAENGSKPQTPPKQTGTNASGDPPASAPQPEPPRT